MEAESERRVLARFKSDTGEETGGLFDVPLNVTVDQLTLICNKLLEQVKTYQPFIHFPF